jgi:glutamine amidotransferase
MQLLAEKSMEGNTKCLGVIDGVIDKFNKQETKVPHMGWNSIEIIKPDTLFNGIKSGEYFYYANSYYLPVVSSTTSTSENKIIFSASLEWNNYYGVQFHPERSGEAGLKLLRNFIGLC